MSNARTIEWASVAEWVAENEQQIRDVMKFEGLKGAMVEVLRLAPEQSELAALREELASRNEVIAMKAREVVEAQTAVTGWAAKCKAAEQRNDTVPTISAEQYEELNDFYLCVCCDSGHRMEKPMVDSLCEVGALESRGFGKHRLTKFGEYLLATAKPTESGASE